jgi:TPR repeat protein
MQQNQDNQEYVVIQEFVDAGYKLIIDGKKVKDPASFKKEENEYLCMAQYYQTIKDYVNMVKSCEKAISVSNDVHAMTKLGYYYQAIVTDPEKMKKYYGMAMVANPNHVSLYINLGLYYEHIEKDIGRAKELYTKGHELGDIECAYKLGNLESIENVYDDSKAREYYTIAANAGHKEAKFSLACMEYQDNKIAAWANGTTYY